VLFTCFEHYLLIFRRRCTKNTWCVRVVYVGCSQHIYIYICWLLKLTASVTFLHLLTIMLLGEGCTLCPLVCPAVYSTFFCPNRMAVQYTELNHDCFFQFVHEVMQLKYHRGNLRIDQEVCILTVGYSMSFVSKSVVFLKRANWTPLLNPYHVNYLAATYYINFDFQRGTYQHCYKHIVHVALNYGCCFYLL
jgi:hypothetical protein